ncbi:MAG: ATP-binding protein [Candidatus Omnitrophota bacterium]|nr:ATP-binding protein [Candidatus Omnitrophota bacterium]
MVSPNPFTPQSGWEPKIFGGRNQELGVFESSLSDAANERLSHLIVLGEWGVGKTSLLKQFRRISQEKGFPAAFCGISKFTEKNKPLDAIHLIAEEMLMGFPKAEKIQEDLLELFSKRKSLSNPQVQFTKFLLELWKSLDTKLAVVLLDDAQNLIEISNTIDMLRAVLSAEDIIKNTRFLFVLSSTPAGWASFIDKHDPVGRFFRKRLNADNLKPAEVAATIDMTLKGTGVEFEESIKKNIFEYTGGHPYEVQLLASHLYDSQIEGVVKTGAWDSALNNTLKELGRDYFDFLLSKASDREKDLLRILAEEKKPLAIKDFTTMMIVGKRAKKFPIANIKNFLYRLEEKGLVKRTENNGFYIQDQMFLEFITRVASE